MDMVLRRRKRMVCKMSKSRANKQNRLRSRLRRQRNDVYKFKSKRK